MQRSSQQAGRLRPGDEVLVTPERMAGDGRATADLSGRRLKIEGALPGEAVRARVFGRDRRTDLARVVEVLAPSPDRVEPRCRHFGNCGGCSWQHVEYGRQLELKRRLLVEALEERGLSAPEVPLPLGVREPWFYRNKMDFDFAPAPGGGVLLGLHRRGSFRTVLDLHECWLQSPHTAGLLESVRRLAAEARLEAYDLRTHTGLLRNLLVLESKSSGRFLVQIVTAPAEGGAAPDLRPFAEALMRQHPQLAGVLHAVHGGRANVANPETPSTLLSGSPTVAERLAGIELQVGPHTFLQRNTEQAERLYGVVIELAALGPGQGEPDPQAARFLEDPAAPGPAASGLEAAGPGRPDTETRRTAPHTVDAIDLYCGFGPISQLLAPRVRSVTGIEVVPEMIEEARRLAAERGVKNARFLLGTAEELLPPLAAELRPQLVVANPPRAGIHKKALRALVQIAASRLVYVSCSPASLADNLQALAAGGYVVERLQPVDLFPHTPHVETVVALRRS
jgi:23S rRNA (uracil1939-C5)-methyltransferase